MKASRDNQIENAKVLMEARADPFLRDNKVGSISSSSIPFPCLQGKTARDWARESGHSDLERLLEDYEENIDQVNLKPLPILIENRFMILL